MLEYQVSIGAFDTGTVGSPVHDLHIVAIALGNG
jgi:hypothetical protein